MTMPASAKGIGGRPPFPDERSAARQLRRILAAQAGEDAKLQLLDEDQKLVEVTLTPGLSQLLMEVLRHVGTGHAVTVVPVSQMLTTQQAADILNVSRPFLISLLERNEMEFTLVGRHRRIRAEALFAYKKARDAKRSDALLELAGLDAEEL